MKELERQDTHVNPFFNAKLEDIADATPEEISKD